VLRAHIDPAIGHKPIGAIRREDIKRSIPSDLVASSQQRCPKRPSKQSVVRATYVPHTASFYGQ
jgi:hypothetical protein